MARQRLRQMLQHICGVVARLSHPGDGVRSAGAVTGGAPRRQLGAGRGRSRPNLKTKHRVIRRQRRAIRPAHIVPQAEGDAHLNGGDGFVRAAQRALHFRSPIRHARCQPVKVAIGCHQPGPRLHHHTVQRHIAILPIRQAFQNHGLAPKAAPVDGSIAQRFLHMIPAAASFRKNIERRGLVFQADGEYARGGHRGWRSRCDCGLRAGRGHNSGSSGRRGAASSQQKRKCQRGSTPAADGAGSHSACRHYGRAVRRTSICSNVPPRQTVSLTICPTFVFFAR